MKVVQSVMVMACVALALVFSFNQASANTYASDVRITFSGSFNTGPAQIKFVLNDSATAVVVRIKQGATVVRTIDAGALRRGENTVEWDGKNDGGTSAPAGAYSVEITTTGPNYATWTKIFESGAPIFTRGVDVNRNPAQRDFGFIYAADNGGATNPRGLWRYRADGAAAGDTTITLGGITYPMVVKNSITAWTGPTGAQRVYFATIDWRGWIWTTDPDSGQTGSAAIRVYKPGDGTTTRVIRGVRWPFGLAAIGTDANFKLYVAADTLVLRYNLGANLTAVPADTVAKFARGLRVIDVMLDDAGAMYVNLRAGTTRDGTSAGGVSTEKYNIAGRTTPVTRADSVWSVKFTGSRPVGIGINRGANLSSNTDDKLYVSASEGNYGVYEISNISTTTPVKTQIFKPTADISSRADVTVDVVGNVILFENSTEVIYFVAPPGASSYTTPAIDPINVTTPLPVELASFTVSVVGNGVELNWTTASETNNYGFEVQRGTDQKTFERIGFVAGNGTTTTTRAYKFTDRDLAAGTYYYRLKQIDTDGTVTFSDAVRADIATVVRAYALHQNYPNPFNPTTTISFDLKETGHAKLRLFNMLGQQVAELVNGQLEAGAHTAILNARALASGTYIYVLEVNGFRAQKRLQIIK
jgi:hypothetical protein